MSTYVHIQPDIQSVAGAPSPSAVPPAFGCRCTFRYVLSVATVLTSESEFCANLNWILCRMQAWMSSRSSSSSKDLVKDKITSNSIYLHISRRGHDTTHDSISILKVSICSIFMFIDWLIRTISIEGEGATKEQQPLSFTYILGMVDWNWRKKEEEVCHKRQMECIRNKKAPWSGGAGDDGEEMSSSSRE